MKRIKSIDTIRGLFLFLMILGHLLDWWLILPDRWIVFYLYSFLAPIAATGYLYTSGFSAAIAYKSRKEKAARFMEITITQARNVYIFRALLLLMISLIYNTIIALALNNLKWIWAWNVLQTISVSLLLAWPLLKAPKYLRIGLGIGLLVVNDLLFPFLLPHKDQQNIYGVFFYILYHPDEAYTILAYFAMFIFGTVVGDFFFDINNIKNQEERKDKINYVFLRTIFIVGVISTSFGLLYRFNEFMYRRTLSAMFYSIGAILILLAILLYLEEFKKLEPKKSYRFFFYYSFYSFSIYLTHDLLYFMFYQQLNAINVWFVLIIVYVLITLLLRFLYQKVGKYASLKAVISIFSLEIANKIEQRKSKKIENKLLVSQ